MLILGATMLLYPDLNLVSEIIAVNFVTVFCFKVPVSDEVFITKYWWLTTSLVLQSLKAFGVTNG